MQNPVVSGALKIWVQVRICLNYKQSYLKAPILGNTRKLLLLKMQLESLYKIWQLFIILQCTTIFFYPPSFLSILLYSTDFVFLAWDECRLVFMFLCAISEPVRMVCLPICILKIQ